MSCIQVFVLVQLAPISHCFTIYAVYSRVIRYILFPYTIQSFVSWYKLEEFYFRRLCSIYEFFYYQVSFLRSRRRAAKFMIPVRKFCFPLFVTVLFVMPHVIWYRAPYYQYLFSVTADVIPYVNQVAYIIQRSFTHYHNLSILQWSASINVV